MRTAFFEVTVAGTNISARLAGNLNSIDITSNEGGHSDTASLEIDDRNAQIILPQIGAPVVIVLGWQGEAGAELFRGTVDEIKSSGNRSGGRILRITAKSVDTLSRAKEPQQKNMDQTTVQDALSQAGKIANMQVKVAPELANVQREWFGMQDESFLAFGERLADELGGVFKVRGNQAILTPKTGGSASGAAMGVFSATWGSNLISWDMTPTMGRPRHKKAVGRWFDKAKAKWTEEEADVPQEDKTDARAVARDPRPDKDQTDRKNKSTSNDAEKERGGGSVDVDGSPSPQPGGLCLISGARPGVDGTYRISCVKHKFARGGGWTTSLSLKMPSGDAGKDSRK